MASAGQPGRDISRPPPAGGAADGLPYSPSITTDASRLAALSEPQGRRGRPLSAASDSVPLLIGCVLMVLMVAGLLAVVTGGRLSRLQQLLTPRLECSDDAVITLVRRILREDMGKGELKLLIDTDATTVALEAIRTRSAIGSGVQCAAHVKLGLNPRPGLAYANPEVAMAITKASEFDIEYKAEPTDDQQQIYVTVQLDTGRL